MGNWHHLIFALTAIWVLPPFYASAFRVKGILPIRWWFGITTAGLIAVTLHALGASKLLSYSILLLFLAAGIFQSGKDFFLKQKGKFSFDRFSFLAFALILPLLFVAYVRILSEPVTPYDWDTIALWFKKVKMLASWFPLKNTRLADWGGNYINYPHIGPMLEMFVVKLSGTFLENYTRLIFPAFFVMWIYALNDLFSPIKNRWFLFLPPFLGYLFFSLRPFTSGYQEGFMTSLAGIAAIQFCQFLILPKHSSSAVFDLELFLGCFFTGMLTFVKSEGILLAFVLIAAFLATLFLMPRIKRLTELFHLTPYLLVTLFLVLLWPGLLLLNHADLTHLQNENYTLQTLSEFFQHLDRMIVIWPFYVRYFAQKSVLLGVCLIFSVVSFKMTPVTRRPLLFLWLVLIGHMIIVTAPYFAAGFNIVWGLKNNFERLMFEHFFVYPVILCVAVRGITDPLLKPETPRPLKGRE